MSLLRQLAASGALRTLDHAFAQSLRRLDPDTPDTVLAAAALASLAVANGHAAFDIAQPRRLVEADIDWPSPESWRADLQASRWVAQPDTAHAESAADAPLVYESFGDNGGLLFLRRYREYECRLAAGLHRIGNATPPAADLAGLAPLFAQLFPQAPRIDPAASDARTSHATIDAHRGDPQATAALSALHHTLLLVTGGPGTGKTTTITRLLALLVAQALHAGTTAPRIALAAPTGRAAERMAESVRNAVQSLAAGVDPALLAYLPTAGTTLHRLLGTIPDAATFRHHADNPLPLDIVVVDEASMIDLPLMAKLVEAVPDGARLVLLGDPDQLPSVEAGDVLAGILRAAGGGEHATFAMSDAATAPEPSPPAFALRPRESGQARSAQNGRRPAPEGRAQRVNPVTLLSENTTSTGSRLGGSDNNNETTAASSVSTFPARRIHLHRSYRQQDSLDLAPLATAVRTGDAATALSLLREHTLDGVHFHEGLTDPLQSHREHLVAHWSALADTTDPAHALALASRLRLLTAVREGPQGARALNARIETLLAERAAATPRRDAPANVDRRYFHGRLLLVTENSYRHRLFNGDIGICLPDAAGTAMAWFPGEDPAHPRPFHPAALPAHDSAFAMTVHKAQGSEFDAVWLLLPDRFNRVLSRELVYTAITRARRELHVAGSAEVIADALGRHAGRWSGLGWRLEK